MKDARSSWMTMTAIALALGFLSACAPPGSDRAAPPVPNENDLAEMAKATQEALENNRDGESANWSDEGGGHLGTATPPRTYEGEAGVACRDFQQTITIDGRTLAAYGSACRDAAGDWNKTRYGGLSDVGPNGPRPVYGAPGYVYPRYGNWPFHGPSFRYGIGFGGHHFHRNRHLHHRHFRHQRHFRHRKHHHHGRGRRYSSR